MTPQETPPRPPADASPTFLPLAFRLAASFGLLVMHIALPWDGMGAPAGDGLYLGLLALLFAESVWEVQGSLARGGKPFGVPSPGLIRFNLLLDVALVTLLIAFQGVDQERLGTIYIFPVLASAFYLPIAEIVGVGLLSSACHIACVLLFSQGVLPAFGHSSPDGGVEPYQLAYILGFASLQIFGATLVVVVIRSHMESLASNLSRSEAEVDELSVLYRSVFRSIFSGIVTTDLEGRITSANAAAEKILQLPLPLGTPIETLGFGSLRDLGDHIKDERFEFAVQVPGGNTRIVGGNVAPLKGGGGGPSGHLLVFQDLTDIKALEERTRVSERMATVGELSSEMAHELRNPLASILGCVQILKQGEQPRAMMDRVLTILLRESERVSALVTDFLDFTRPRPVRIQVLELREVSEEWKASWETDPRSEGIDLDMAPPPDLRILGDPVWVHQIFTNLLTNARKALKGAPGPRISIRFQVRPGFVTTLLTDNGCGMTEERRRALFIPFSSGFEEGTGLGMSLVFQFTQQMGWGISVESAVGKGTTVRLEIPLEPGTFSSLAPGPQ
jgi:two-component system sensor histidine kinase PilS (NtrC family)